MKITHKKVNLEKASPIKGRVNKNLLDATTEQNIAQQQHEDDISALQDAAQFTRRVRESLGLTQREFSYQINVSLETIRNWEQGKRYPTGAAKTLLKILDKAPKAALLALHAA